MSRYLSYLFPAVPAALQESFRQYRLLRLLLRVRWLFWITLFFQVVLFLFDWLRYHEGKFSADPVYLRLFCTHILSFVLSPVYWFAYRTIGSVRRGNLIGAERWTYLVYGCLTVYGLPRAVFAYQDRETLILYGLYLLISQVVLLMPHRSRVVSTLVGMAVMVPVVWVRQAANSIEQYTTSVEVALLTLGIMVLGTYLYNVFLREFIQNHRIEEQNQILKKQAFLFEANRKRAVQELEQRSQELISYVLQEQQRNSFLLELRERIGQAEPDRLTQSIDLQLNQEERWKYFVTLFERLHPLFFSRLQSAYPTLNTNDLRLIAMLKLNLSTKEISTLLGISPQSANTARYRLRKRLDLPAEAALESFLQQY